MSTNDTTNDQDDPKDGVEESQPSKADAQEPSTLETEPQNNTPITWLATTKPTNKEPLQKAKRQMCTRCSRPQKVCICEGLPSSPLQLQRCHVLVLQHPHEAKLQNRSLPLVQLCLDPSHLTVAVSRRFGDQVDPSVISLMQPETSSIVLLVFPAQDDLECAQHERNQTLTLSQAREYCRSTPTTAAKEGKEESNNKDKGRNDKILIVLLDATWKFAKEMDKANLLNDLYPPHMKRVALSWDDPLRPAEAVVPRRFDIRTPPSEVHLSTAECIAWLLSALEDEDDDNEHSRESHDKQKESSTTTSSIYSTLMKALDCMVDKWHECTKNATDNHHHRGGTSKKKKKRQRQEQEP